MIQGVPNMMDTIPPNFTKLRKVKQCVGMFLLRDGEAKVLVVLSPFSNHGTLKFMQTKQSFAKKFKNFFKSICQNLSRIKLK
jgi:hypothetical protein